MVITPNTGYFGTPPSVIDMVGDIGVEDWYD